MNTNALKKFAQEARRKLIEQVGSKLEYVINTDTPELREKADQINKLKEAIQSTSKEQVIDKVTYTWFNRFIALRFMDANDFQPIGIRVLTPKNGYTLPELLDEAKQGNIPDELAVKNERIFDLLDGKIPSANPQNEAYKELLIGACNHLNKVLPFLFERINDYTELLLPDDLTSELSIIQDIRDGMSVEDCAEVEIVGWLYQFYISEKNAELISSKKVYKKEDLAPASQLFTPKWIVQYMVDNTLGQVWSEINPNTKVTEGLEFYIKPAYQKQVEKREKKSIEEIKFFEPCAGSGHILAYAFDVFYKIYEEEGYNPTEIPELIITKNLFGVDIDQRAAQLASFVLLMKGRQKNRRFLRAVETQKIQPNIAYYQDFEFDTKFNNATALGSLIKIEPSELNNLSVDEGSLFGERQSELKVLYQLLGQRYDVVVTNPPYINSSRIEGSLKQYIGKEFKHVKSDLFSCFIVQCLNLTNDSGLTGFVTPFVWMFIKSYEELRGYLIKEKYISSLVRPSYTSFFDSAIVPLTTFVIRNENCSGDSTFFDLGYLGSGSEQIVRLRRAMINDDDINVDGKKSKFVRSQRDFTRIPGIPIGYWLSEKFIKIFETYEPISKFSIPKFGMSVGDGQRFIRYKFEISIDVLERKAKSLTDFSKSKKWAPFDKGGAYRRWYGNQEHVVYWRDNGEKVRNHIKSAVRSPQYFLQKHHSWTLVCSSEFSARKFPNGFLLDTASNCLYFNSISKENLLLGFLNSKVASEILSLLNPTLNFSCGVIAIMPFSDNESAAVDQLVEDSVNISKIEWNSHETSWDFSLNELIRIQGQDLEETYYLFQQYWKNKFIKLHKNEEELNRWFIKIYGLEDDLTPNVSLEEISILQEETVIQNGQLVFKQSEVFAQFMSYAVGCMFGRYSLDKEALILANQGETLEDYIGKVELSEDKLSFIPDEDNIIPVLDDEWFEDDITGRFYAFLKASFGTANFDKNLAFVEECLGKDVRKYFVKDFYNDHIKRYKKRPIYWMFSSPKGTFNVLIYMHRYTPDTLNKILNGYLIQYREKLNTHLEHLDHLTVSGTSIEQTKAIKEKDKLKLVLLELKEYERDILYPLATERINIDLDEGVLVNYNKFGNAIKEVKGLNDKVTKKKVRAFDWIDVTTIK